MLAELKPDTRKVVQCYHCGADCSEIIREDDRSFCCDGCRMVYNLLSENNLCTYYSLSEKPGHPADPKLKAQFEVLDRPEIRKKFLRFESETSARAVFRIDGMHCVSCIWLLEHLHKVNAGISSAIVNFPAKEITIDFNPAQVTPSGIAALLASLGYTPSLNLGSLDEKQKSRIDPRVIKIGVAGFCFGNIMMLSFPEYLGADISTQSGLVTFFAWLSLALSLPSLLYCGSGFFRSAWTTIRYGTLNIDAPIALAIGVTFARSVYLIVVHGEAGYLDSMSGIIFFMLLGRYFQDRTYERLNFDRDYRSYFPIAVMVKKDGKESSVPVTELKPGDVIYIRANELIPADSKLRSERTYVDYSFVSGESIPVAKNPGDDIYAGARQQGGAAEYEVINAVSSSYLTQLWNGDALSKRNNLKRQTYIDAINKWFSLAILVTAFGGAGVWLLIDPAVSLDVLTAVMIVACPCTLLLAATFTNGSVLRWLGRAKFYLKNADAIERIATADHIVFDKTGTITYVGSSQLEYKGDDLSPEEWGAFVSLAKQSGHPLSRAIVAAYRNIPGEFRMEHVMEISGSGIRGMTNGSEYLLGSSTLANGGSPQGGNETAVWAAIDGKVKGRFIVHNQYRKGLREMTARLKQKFRLSLLSGDNDAEKSLLSDVFGTSMKFRMSPTDKLNTINSLKADGSKVMMIGDGLNDSGALMAADAGIAVSDNTNNYFPACDAILDGSVFSKLDKLLKFVRSASRIVKITFIISLLYNVVGMYYSLSGQLSPLVAAVLMPVSSFTIIIFTTLGVRISAHRQLRDCIA